MPFEFRLATAFLVIAASLIAVIGNLESNLPGCIDDLPPAEREAVNQLRSFGYVVSDSGFS